MLYHSIRDPLYRGPGKVYDHAESGLMPEFPGPSGCSPEASCFLIPLFQEQKTSDLLYMAQDIPIQLYGEAHEKDHAHYAAALQLRLF